MTTYRRFVLDAASGVVAIYDTTTRDLALDNEPLSAPLSYVSRLHFDSRLQYPRVVSTLTGTLSLASVPQNTYYDHEHVIAAHGLGGFPYVEGKVQIGGVWRALSGSTIVQQQDIAGFPLSKGYMRHIALGVNATHIVIEEYAVTYALSLTSLPSLSVPYEIYLTDTLL